MSPVFNIRLRDAATKVLYPLCELGQSGCVSGYTNPEFPDRRLSNAEREEAVGHLATAEAEGRLTAPEYEQRATAARAAVTRGDLVPLFADLPEPAPAEEQLPRTTAATAPGMPGPITPPPGAYTSDVPPSYEDSGRGRALGGAVGATVMALVPFLAVGLFFLFGFNGSFAWSWLWFLLIPIAGIIIYGPGSEYRRSRR